MTHISTFANTNSLFSQTFRLQSNYALAQSQSASGLKAPDGFQGIAQRLRKICLGWNRKCQHRSTRRANSAEILADPS